MSGRGYHVVHNSNGGWDVKKGGGKKSSGHFNTKAEAIKRGRELAKNNQTELVTHGLDGQIQNSDSYGNDPNPPKDKKH